MKWTYILFFLFIIPALNVEAETKGIKSGQFELFTSSSEENETGTVCRPITIRIQSQKAVTIIRAEEGIISGKNLFPEKKNETKMLPKVTFQGKTIVTCQFEGLSFQMNLPEAQLGQGVLTSEHGKMELTASANPENKVETLCHFAVDFKENLVWDLGKEELFFGGEVKGKFWTTKEAIKFNGNLMKVHFGNTQKPTGNPVLEFSIKDKAQFSTNHCEGWGKSMKFSMRTGLLEMVEGADTSAHLIVQEQRGSSRKVCQCESFIYDYNTGITQITGLELKLDNGN